MNIENLGDYQKAVELLNKMAHHYYVLDEPIASDSEYDELYYAIKIYEESHTNLPTEIYNSSPTRRVGGEILEGFSKNTHLARMWSLDDVFSSNEADEWVNRILKNAPHAQFVCSPKFDGVSLNLLYDNGVLVSATTRGDGMVGELVTQNALTIKDIPYQISYTSKIEIRGEVLISKSDFIDINAKREKIGAPPLANPRNAAAGSLRQLDSKITAKRALRFIPWGVGFFEKEDLISILKSRDLSYFSILELLGKFGFHKIPFLSLCKCIEDIEQTYKSLIAKRESYEFMLDGMVVMVDSLHLHNILGWTMKSPRFACAYKFPPTEKTTILRSVTFQVGRTGTITPVASLAPIDIDGALVSRATLHNFSEIAKKDIRIGDKVVLIRSGEVIPKILYALTSKRDGKETPIIPPTHCPECGGELLVEDILIKCQNLNCKARVKESIIHFASKKALNIDGLGEKIVYELFDKGLVTNILDLYSLEKSSLLALEGWQEKRTQNLIDSIASTKGVELWRLVNALGIEHIGEKASKDLCRKFGASVFKASFEEVANLYGFGERMARSLVEFNSSNANLITKLLEIVKPSITTSQEIQSTSVLSDKNIVITGTFSKPREHFVEILEALGARVSSSISKKTDFLLCGENAGSKLAKAQEFGVKILSEQELKKLLD